MLPEVRDEITRRINQLDLGAIFSLTSLLGDAWEDLGSGKARRSIGSAFSLAVRRGEFPQCVAIGLIGTDRDAKYRRVG